MSFQAPPEPGLYTFQVYALSDSFVGTDAQRDLRVSIGRSILLTSAFLTLAAVQMRVEAPQNGHAEDDEDDISDPEEDTIAGQMALMKGQPVKRISQDGSDDEDDSDDDEDDSDSDDSDTSSSDSDSD